MNKIGVPKKVKWLVGAIVIILVVICCGYPVLFFTFGITPPSGDHLFSEFILTPMPKSVKVLDSYDGDSNLDPDYCLHFKISPDDFQLILASRKWEVVSEEPFPHGVECSHWSSPPIPLGSNFIIYSFVPGEKDVEVMFTNSQMNEVFYYYFNGNTR